MHHQQPVQQQRPAGTVSIWAGDLDSYMDENFLRSAVAACGWASDITRIKVVRDRFTGAHAGYGFLDAASPEAASRVLQTGSGMPIPGSTRCWRLNMGRQGGGGHGNLSLGGAGAETNVYVGDLDHSVTEFQLMSAFRPRYASTRHAKVVCNEFGVSRGFGFVRFGDAAEAERAVAEMQGFEFHGKPIRLSPANGRGGRGGNGHGMNSGGNNHNHNHHNHNGGGMHHGGGGGMMGPNTTHKRPRQSMASDDPNNTTLFIGGTGSHVNEEVLMREFAAFGEIEAVRVPTNKTGFCFVRFKLREEAERAKEEMTHAHVAALNAHKAVRLEWATEQISVRNNGNGNNNANNNNNINNNNSASMYAQGQGGAEIYLPHQTTYRVEPVRVPIGSHALAMPPHGVPPPLGALLGPGSGAGVSNTNGGAAGSAVPGVVNKSENETSANNGNGNGNGNSNSCDDQPPAKKANVAGVNDLNDLNDLNELKPPATAAAPSAPSVAEEKGGNGGGAGSGEFAWLAGGTGSGSPRK